MIRTAICLMIPMALMLLAGCGPKMSVHNTRQSNVAEAGGLRVSLDLPHWQFTQGQDVQAVVTVTNLTGATQTIEATSGAPVFIRLERRTPLDAWEELQRWPRSEIMVMNTWKLAPHEQRKFTMTLHVGPDWPAGETLRLTAELNGRPAPSPGINVSVKPPARPGQKE